MEGRTTSAVTRRAEQLKRWQESDTNKESIVNKKKSPKIKFPHECVFLAACASADKDDVKKRLEEFETDINTANIDGLTALHQACIDDNLEMVEFLVENGSDLNCGDNEGWTPLHATASCGYISIAKYLIDAGANVAAVNNDGDLPIDIAECDEMEELLQVEINRQGIDCEKARNAEEKMMMEDAEEYSKDPSIPLKVHLKTGATPLHVASAKGYINVMIKLIDSGINLDTQDFDGWTPLHAAAHWCQREACQLLIESLCDLDVKNLAGQKAFDVADPDILPALNEMKEKQATLKKNKKQIDSLIKKNDPPPLKRRTSVTRMSVADKSNVVMKDASSERAALLKHPEDSQTSRITETIEEDEGNNEENAKDNVGQINNNEQIDIWNELIRKSDEQDIKDKEEPKKSQSEDLRNKQRESSKVESKPSDVSIWFKAPSTESVEKEKKQEGDISNSRQYERRKNTHENIKNDQEISVPSVNSSQPTVNTRVTPLNSTNRNRASWNLPTITNASLLRSASFPNSNYRTRPLQNDNHDTDIATSLSSTTLAPTVTSPSLVTTSLPCTANVRRSTVPPVRDDESETQRRAHAKRVRETRRSTQGVTLEDLKSAEQQYLKKQQEEDEKKEREKDNKENDLDKRTSWRQRYQQLQDDDTPYKRSRNLSSEAICSVSTSALTTPTITSTTTSSSHQTVTLPIRSDNLAKSDDENKDNEDQDKSSHGTQAVIIRRRRPKRRSTGVVCLDLDDVGKTTGSAETKATTESSSETKSRSRFSGSSQSLASSDGEQSTTLENGETESVDYKKLYEDVKLENDKLKEKLSKTEANLKEARDQLDKVLLNNRNSLSDAEKRERRALERKLSEMEEELKQMERLKLENAKYRDENGALIRVISKLSK